MTVCVEAMEKGAVQHNTQKEDWSEKMKWRGETRAHVYSFVLVCDHSGKLFSHLQ